MRISKIELKKSNVILTLDDGNKLEFTREILGEFYLYVNKELSEELLTQFRQYNEMAIHYAYVLRILSRHHYTVSEIRKKLYQRVVSLETSEKIITRLTEHRLLDDQSYAKNLTDYYQKQHYGPHYISEKLKQKGISDDIIDAVINQDDMIQTESAKHLANKLVEKRGNHSKSALLNQIYSKLTRYGYSPSVASEVVSGLKDTLQFDEHESLLKDYLKARQILARKCEDEKKIDDLVIKKLMQKGYRYPHIKKVIEEQKYVYQSI